MAGRRTVRLFAVLAIVAVVAGACSSSGDKASTAKSGSTGSTAALSGDAAAINQIVLDHMQQNKLMAVIVRVTVGGKDVLTKAFGDSMTGVPTTTNMHFRNGAVEISYVSTAVLRLVDQKKLSLDDKISKWRPDMPGADKITLKMLLNMTSGYRDYVTDDAFVNQFNANPWKAWTNAEKLAFPFPKPLLFEPGTNWSYAHTNYVVLSEVLTKATGKPMAQLLEDEVLKPMGLKNTVASQTATIPEPALHSFDAERRSALGIPAGTKFIEESTYWNPSWTLGDGQIETSDIVDMATTADAIGDGRLLSPESHHAQVDPNLLGFGAPLAGCPACHTLDTKYNYGLGVVRSGNWLLQNPLFAGLGSIEANLPSKKLSIAIAATGTIGSFGEDGSPANWTTDIFKDVAAHLAPNDAPG
jgi:CubicO group peptidase (beta-lactamase class C family)